MWHILTFLFQLTSFQAIEDTKEQDKTVPASSPQASSTKKKKDDDDYSPEDRKLKEDLDTLVETVMAPIASGQSQDEYLQLQKTAIDAIVKEIRSATSTMTAIPKPLKFLRPHYPAIESFYNDFARLAPSSPNKPYIADILSVLSMTLGSEERLVLKYRLAGSGSDVTQWGHEYLRALAGELAREYEARASKEDEEEMENVSVDISDLTDLIESLVAYLFSHGGELDACDLLFDIGQLSRAVPLVQPDNVVRVGKYLVACSNYLADNEEQQKVLKVCFDMYLATNNLVYALLVALRLPEDQNQDLIREIFAKAADIPEEAPEDTEIDRERSPAAAHVACLRQAPLKRQLCYIIAGQNACRPYMEEIVSEEEYQIMGNTLLSKHFKELCKDLDALTPRSPADVFKEHLQEGTSARAPRPSSTGGPLVDSVVQNMAQSFVNAFTNVGTGRETLLLDNSEWLFRNKGAGMICAAASVGLVHLWDVEEGFSAADKYSLAKEPQIQAGALLASGMLATGVTSEMNAAFAILSEQLEHEDLNVRLCAALGLGLGYVNTRNEEILEMLVPIIVNGETPIEMVSMCVLALGLIFVSSAHDEILGSVLEAVIDRQEGRDLDTSAARLLCVGMGLLYLGTNATPEGALESFAVIEHPINQYLVSIVKSFAFAGTGNVVALQQIMGTLTNKVYEEEDDEADEGAAKKAGSSSSAAAAAPTTAPDGKKYGQLRHIHQGSGVIGLAAVVSGETLTQQMLARTYDHLLQCSDTNIRRAVPLGYAVNYVSNPDIAVTDILVKLAHDQDQYVSMNACLALGFVGAGTNNSRIAQILRNLASYFALEPHHLYCVRVAQGLLYLGKGTCTLNPITNDGNSMDKSAMAAILTVMHCCLDLPNILIKHYPYLLYSLAAAIRPRYVVTVNEESEQVPISVRVGQAVDTVGAPGNPRTLSGFTTNNTPVLLSVGDRAELVTDDYLPMTPVIEGIVVVRKNPLAVSKEI